MWRNGDVMAGKHRAKKTERRQSGAYALLGTSAVTLGLGVAFTLGSGVAQAEPNNSTVGGSSGIESPGRSAETTAIRTTISAQSVSTSTHSFSPAVGDDEEQATSVVITKDSVVRQMDPAVTGDNNPGPSPTLTESLVDHAQGDQSGLTSGIPGLDVAPYIPFIELGGGGGGLLAKIASALSGGML